MSEDLNKLLSAVKEDKKQFSKWLTLADGEIFVGRYKGFKEGFGKYGPKVSFIFDVEGVEKTFDRAKASINFLSAMVAANVEIGDLIKVKRIGTGTATDYKVTKLNPSDKPGEVQLEQEKEKDINAIFKKS